MRYICGSFLLFNPSLFSNFLFLPRLPPSLRVLLLFYLLFYLYLPLAAGQTKVPPALSDSDQSGIEINKKSESLENMNLNVTENNGCGVVGTAHTIAKRNVGTFTTTPAGANDVYDGNVKENGTRETKDVTEEGTEEVNEENRATSRSGRSEDEDKEYGLTRAKLEYDKVLPFVLAYVSTMNFQVVHIYTSKGTPPATIARLFLRLSQEGVFVYIRPRDFSLRSNSSSAGAAQYTTRKTLHLAEVDQFPLRAVAQASVRETWLLLAMNRNKAEGLMKELTFVKMPLNNQVIFVTTPDATKVFDQTLKLENPKSELEPTILDSFFDPRTSTTGQGLPPEPEGDGEGPDVDTSPYKDVYKIYEVYSPSPRLPHRYLHLGSWYFEGGAVQSEFSDLGNPLRRRDLTGLHIRCATIGNFLPYVTIDHEGDYVRMRGWYADIYASMIEFFNFTSTCVETVDGEWGALRDDTWSGLVGMLVRDEADIIVAPLDHVEAREEVIDYIIGISVLGYQLLIKRPDMSDSMWKAYILVFSEGVWLSLCVSLVLSLIALAVSVTYSPNESKTRISEVAMIPIYAVSQQGWFSDVTARSCRIAYITLYLTTTLSYAAYTSTLTSALATQRMTLPFVDMAGALMLGSYGLGFPKGYSVETAFRYATEGFYKDVWDKLIMSDPENLVPNDDAGIERVLTKKYAFLAQDVYTRLDHIVPSPCDYVALPKDYFTLSTSMALRSGVPYRDLFNAYILKMKDSGILDKMRRKHVSQYENCEEAGTRSLGIPNVFSAFMLVPIGIGLALIFLFGEFVYERMTRTEHQQPSISAKRLMRDEGHRKPSLAFPTLELDSAMQRM